MPTELFVDTSAWFALASRGSVGHAKVEASFRERLRLGTRIVTTNLIVAETHALMLHRTSRNAALTLIMKMFVPPTIIVASTTEMEMSAVSDWLTRYQDQDFSLTDAVSFVVMRDRKIQEALTLDHHFAVVGFAMVPG